MLKTLCIILMIAFSSCNLQAPKKSFVPGEIWLDMNDTPINAHGGGILIHKKKYYWFGEHKTSGKAGNKANVGVHCYSSDDIYNWQDEGIALQVISDDESHPITKGCVLERPKVIYNEATSKFVMWFHLELKGQGYDAALTGLATADQVTGPYTYQKSLRPNKGIWPENYPEHLKKKPFDVTGLEKYSDEWNQAMVEGMFLHRDLNGGQMSRDMTLYVDENGKAYHIHASEENFTLHISELNDSYTDFTERYVRVQPGGHNEAPSIFKKDGKYFMITSGCTGWAPNAARLLVADSIMGDWEYVKNPCIGPNADITFDSQSTFILPFPDNPEKFIFMADRWRPENAIDGRYVWLPILFDDSGYPTLRWKDEWKLNDAEYR